MGDKSFFVRIFITLIAIEFLLLSGILVAQSYVVSKVSMGEMAKSGEEKIDVVQNYAEIILNDIEKTALYIALDDNVQVLDNINGGDIAKTENIFAVYGLIDFLKRQTSVDSRIFSIYIYAEDIDTVVSSEGDICRTANLRDGGWRDYYSTDLSFCWSGRRQIQYGIEEYGVITLVYPFKNFSSSRNYAVVINVAVDTLNNILLSNYSGDSKSAFMIFDGGTQLMAQTADTADIVRAIAQKLEDGESVLRDSMLYTCNVSEYNSWKYVNAVSVRFPDNQTKTIVAGMLIAAVCMLTAVVLMSYFISKRFAKPVEQLIKKINGREKQGNEFEIIDEVFDAMLKKEKYIQNMFGGKDEDIQSVYLRRCLEGEMNEFAPSLLLGEDSSAYYMLVVASAGNYTRLAARFTEEELASVRDMIRIVGEKVFSGIGSVVGTETGVNVFVWLVGLNGDERGALAEKAARLMREIETVTDETAAVIVSEEFASPEEIDDVYRICMEQRADYIMYNDGGVLYIENAHKREQSGFEYPQALERSIIGCLDLNDRAGYARAVGEFFSQIRAAQLSYDMVRIVTNQLLGALLSYLSASSVNVMEVFEENVYTVLADLETLGEIELFIYNIGIRIITYRRNNAEGDDNYYISKIIEFINANYRRDISVSDIAQSVRLSYSHVRKVFFEKMHTNILSYVNGIRIEEAKKLLSSTNRTILEIAQEIGYNNEQSFSRYFKKSTGITPGEYRRRKQDLT